MYLPSMALMLFAISTGAAASSTPSLPDSSNTLLTMNNAPALIVKSRVTSHLARQVTSADVVARNAPNYTPKATRNASTSVVDANRKSRGRRRFRRVVSTASKAKAGSRKRPSRGRTVAGRRQTSQSEAMKRVQNRLAAKQRRRRQRKHSPQRQ